MDSDEFVARMVAAGVPDMQLLPEMNHKPTAFKPLPSTPPPHLLIECSLTLMVLESVWKKTREATP
jgi:hypothetical protein